MDRPAPPVRAGWRAAAAMALIGLAAVACGTVPTSDPSGVGGSGSTVPGGVVPSPSPTAAVRPAVTPSPDAIPAVETALVAAQRWLKLPRSALRVESVTAADWPTRGMGCPEPGVVYANVDTPGYVVDVDGGGKELEYHVDHTGHLGLCRETNVGS